MHINYLILAHKNVQQIVRLIKALQSDDSSIYIHLDKKWKISPLDIEIICNAANEVHVIKERVSTFLDDRSLVLASLSLLKAAYKEGVKGYFILMSAQDYPIKPISDLRSLFIKNYPKPYIDCTPYDKSNWMYYKYKNSALYNKILHSFSNSGKPLLKKIERKLHKLHFGNHYFSLYKCSMHYGMRLYGGSAWWALPDVAVGDILRDIENDKRAFELSLSTYTPEETFFQTYVMRTRISNLVEINSITERKQNCLTYANFETPTKKFCGHPYIITADDWKWLKNRSEYIARKFDLSVDANIFDTIDSDIKK